MANPKENQRMAPEGELSTFHELISDIVHIDVGIIRATEERPFSILYTMGMSALR